METYNKWKYSPTTGKQLYSIEEIAQFYGISSQLLNKVLVKHDFLLPKDEDHNYYRVKNKAYGETLYFNPKTYSYQSEPTDETTNVTPKFNELGKSKIENRLNKLNLISMCDINIDYDELEHFFPEGNFALSVRRPGTKFNYSPNAPTKIYISKRSNRDGSHFNRNYMYISDDDAKAITNDIKKWWREKHLKPKISEIHVDNSEIVLNIIRWKDQYFFDRLEKAGYTIKLSKDQIKNNKQILNDIINN